MQRYPVKSTTRRGLTPESLEAIARSHFEQAERDGASVRASYGAIGSLVTRLDGRDLVVELSMNPQVPADVQQETIRRYNRFLEEATGFSTKERAKKLRKAATAPGGVD